jgi:hypothetical protein
MARRLFFAAGGLLLGCVAAAAYLVRDARERYGSGIRWE